MSDDAEPAGWGAPCDARPDTKVKISIAGCSSKTEVDAYVFGSWAVHRAVGVAGIERRPDPDSWAVSHRPTGHSIGLALELGFWDAIRIALALDDAGILVTSRLLDQETSRIFEATIGAALNDQYVWPIDAAIPPAPSEDR